jgi:hypothetical protein
LYRELGGDALLGRLESQEIQPTICTHDGPFAQGFMISVQYQFFIN